MSRRYVVEDDGALLTALAGRVDSLERAHRVTVNEVSGLRRGLTELMTEIRRRPAPGAAGAGAPGGAGGGDGQPDWVAVDDVDTARAWLAEVDRGRQQILTRHGMTVTAPCWSVHPDVVTCLTALLAERAAAYAGDRTGAVLDWLTRWAPAITTRIDASLAGCIAERAHTEHGHSYHVRDLDTASVAAWWVKDRHIPAPEAFALPVIR